MKAVAEDLVNDMAIIAYLGAKMGDFDRTNAIHAGLEAMNPDNKHLVLASAVNDVMAADYIAALKKLNKLVTADPEFYEAKSWLGFCQASSGNAAGGSENLDYVLENTEPGAPGYEIAKDLKKVLASTAG